MLNPPSYSPLHKQQVLVEQLKLDLQGNHTSNISFLLVSVVVFIFFSQNKPGNALALWIGFTLLVSLQRLLLSLYLKTTLGQPDWSSQSIRLNCLSAFLYSLSWAGMFILCFDASSDSVYLLISINLGMMASSVITSANYLPFFFIVSLPITATMASTLISQADGQLKMIGVLSLVCYGLCSSLVIKFNRNIRQSIQLRFEKDQLLKELERKRQQAEKSSSDKSRFLAEAIHDLRQPLHALGLFFDTIKSRAPTPDPLFSKVDASIENLEHLFDSLLDISKLEANVVSVNPSSFYSQPLLQELKDEYQGPCQTKKLDLKIHSDVAVLHTDRQLLKRILSNLLSNAVRYTNSGYIELSIQNRDRQEGSNWALVSLQDTGIGISKSEQALVFEAFYQGSQERQQGLGLGLAIVQRLSQLLMLDLQLDSELGRGSRFQFAIPCGHARDVQETPTFQPIPSNHQADILVLDDDLAILEAMSNSLSIWGYQAITAASLTEAIQAIKNPSNDIELIISDYSLSGSSNGIEAISTLRQHGGNQHLPAMLISGDTAAEILSRAESQQLPLLHKPLRPGVLRLHIFKLLQGNPSKVGTP